MGTTNKFVSISANAIIGGTAAELGGGKFANGAITSSYVILFDYLNRYVVAQRGANNCVAGVSEYVDHELGGDYTQEDFRYAYKPNSDPNKDLIHVGDFFCRDLS